MADIKKLIEVAIPLDDINAASAREKSIRHGHPSTLHLWWARRPLATARAVLFASLVDAPSSHPEIWPTEEEQEAERQRLFDIIRELVQWENVNNEEVLEKARAEIRRWNPEMPTLLDPFAGGGAIPLEAQRLGLNAIAADLNPVAVMINKAMIEIPPRFKDLPPVNPEDRAVLVEGGYHGAQGLAKDIHYYGELLKQKAYEKIGGLYPKVKDPETGEERTVIAWIWARTVKCPNPACGCEMPLVKSFWLSKKKGKEAYIEPVVEDGHIRYEVRHGKGEVHEGTVSRTSVRCACCGTETPISYVQEESKQGRMGERLIAVVAEGNPGRFYLSAPENHEKVAEVSLDGIDYPDGEVANDPRHFSPNGYGMSHFAALFTHRQLKMLTTLADLLPDIETQILQDASKYLSQDSNRLQDDGKGAKAYSEAIAVYLAFVIDKLADRGSTLCGWDVSREGLRNTFGRQALSMSWDFAEANPFSNSSGCFDNMLEWVEKVVDFLPCSSDGKVIQQNASQDNDLRNIMVSSDPPYYDNIGYADLSDFLYIWMRRSLQHIYPRLFSTMVTPKKEELVASPYRFPDKNGKATKFSHEQAKNFFEAGMAEVCKLLHTYTRDDLPVTIYYAFKQSDTDDTGKSSSGWETMLSAIIQSGFAITGTWPVRTEMANRTIAHETNALASSIVLVCRKRSSAIGSCSRKEFVRKLRRELTSAIAKLQSANIAPVDMMQSAIGPGISVYSRYEHVLEADGTEMSVRTALQLINQELDTFFGGQSEGLDAETRFSIELYTQQGYGEMAFGTADVLARAMNTSVAHIAETGCIVSGKGIVRLMKREELPDGKKGWSNEPSWMRLQRLAHAMEREGIRGCAELLMNAVGGQDELKHLAYRMYQIAEDRSESSEASVYNNLVISWEDIIARANEMRAAQPQETELAFGEEDHHA